MEQHFLNSLYFKSIIISYDKYELIDMLNNNDNPLETFIILLNDTAHVDPSFFALDDEILDKIYYVVNKYRFDDINRNEDTINKVNDIIIFCNEVRSFSQEDKDEIYYEYIKKQSVERHKIIVYEEDLFEALSMDAIVYEAVKNNNIDNTYKKNNIISTTNYLLHNYFPLVLDKDYYTNLNNILMDDNVLSNKEKRKGKKLLKTMKKINNII